MLDASAAVEWLLQTSAGLLIERRVYSRNETLHSPHLIDLEVAQVLHRLVREGTISARRGEEALQDLMALRIARYPHVVLLARIWRHRHKLSAYDAAYVALAESLGATLITRDTGLSTASGHAARIELF